MTLQMWQSGVVDVLAVVGRDDGVGALIWRLLVAGGLVVVCASIVLGVLGVLG